MKKIGVYFLGFCFFGSLVFSFVYFRAPIFKKMQKGEKINFLLVGADHVKGGSHADVVLWVSFEPKTYFVDLVSIPRDTLIRWDRGWIPRKVSELLYLNTKRLGMQKGMRTFEKEIEKLLSVDFDYYFFLTFSAFTEFIDVLGGVPVRIEEPMHYDDNWGNLHIHFEPGDYVLNGEDALKYIRYRKTPLGDIARIKRQQNFLEKILKEFFKFKTIFLIPEFLKVYRRNVFTNFKLVEFFPVLEILRSIKIGTQRFQILPGYSQRIVSKDVWRIDREALKEIRSIIAASSKELWPRNSLKPFLVKRKKGFLADIKAEVFNATKRKGLAEKLSKSLREYGCDVVLWGNWGALKKHTEVITRNGDFSKASRLARILGCSRIRTEIDSSRMVDVSVVIGSDFPQGIIDESRTIP
ncbi:MAG: LCP family protein [Elusimicrobia bacterium]|nr:LCP family protein [Elusimicrobiota bacterium]